MNEAIQLDKTAPLWRLEPAIALLAWGTKESVREYWDADFCTMLAAEADGELPIPPKRPLREALGALVEAARKGEIGTYGFDLDHKRGAIPPDAWAGLDYVFDESRRTVFREGAYEFSDVQFERDALLRLRIEHALLLAPHDPPDGGSGFDPDLPRWPLTAALTWIATGDEHLTRRLGLESVDHADTEAEIRGSIESRTIPTPSDAWPKLAAAMDDGKLFAFVTRVRKEKGNPFEHNASGVRFPPEAYPGAASAHELVDHDQGTVLRPVGAADAHEWIEFRAVTFRRDDILGLWPAKVSATGPDSETTGSPRNPERQPTQTVNDRKRIATDAAIEALGFDALSKLPQKDREAQILAHVRERDSLTVTGRYARERFGGARNARERS